MKKRAEQSPRRRPAVTVKVFTSPPPADVLPQVADLDSEIRKNGAGKPLPQEW